MKGLENHPELNKYIDNIEFLLAHDMPEEARINIGKSLEYIVDQYQRQYTIPKYEGENELLNNINKLSGVVSNEDISSLHILRRARNAGGAHRDDGNAVSMDGTRRDFTMLKTFLITKFLVDIPVLCEKRLYKDGEEIYEEVENSTQTRSSKRETKESRDYLSTQGLKAFENEKVNGKSGLIIPAPIIYIISGITAILLRIYLIKVKGHLNFKLSATIIGAILGAFVDIIISKLAIDLDEKKKAKEQGVVNDDKEYEYNATRQRLRLLKIVRIPMLFLTLDYVYSKAVVLLLSTAISWVTGKTSNIATFTNLQNEIKATMTEEEKKARNKDFGNRVVKALSGMTLDIIMTALWSLVGIWFASEYSGYSNPNPSIINKYLWAILAVSVLLIKFILKVAPSFPSAAVSSAPILLFTIWSIIIAEKGLIFIYVMYRYIVIYVVIAFIMFAIFKEKGVDVIGVFFKKFWSRI